MRIGFMSPYDKERMAFAKKNGFGSVELMVDFLNDPPEYTPGRDGWKKKAAALKADYDASDIRISCVAACYVNHMDPKIEEKAREAVRNAIVFAKEIGCGVIAGFAGRLVDRPLEESLPKFQEVWGAHAKFADDHGVKIAFECCPMGSYHSPCKGINCIATPDMYRKCFDSVDSRALGLEWDASHLIGLFVDPIVNLREFADRVYHVHVKGARVNWDIVKRFGYWYPGAIEHCMPGFGDEDWAQIIKELYRAGYSNDLNIEGWHDAVFRDHSRRARPAGAPVIPDLEDAGLIIAKNHVAQWLPAE